MSMVSSNDPEAAILRHAMALSPAERAAFLEAACAQDQALRKRIEERLKAQAIQLPLKPQPSPAGPGGTVPAAGVPGAHDKNDQADLTPSSDSDTSVHGRFLPGTRIAGRYRIVSRAGKGGMGEVYRADDLKLGHSVALKFLPQDLEEGSQRLEYFLNEVRLSRQISHPNVCRVYDVGEVDGQHFLSMEYIDGEDLKSLLRRIGRVPQLKGVQIAQELCAGLAAAHEKGVLHRDLKPANVMIDGQGHARITDFGLARLAKGESSTGGFAGTPAYMAPEQLARGETSIQSDLYSLGLLLYELFTGHTLHPAGSIPELLRAHQDAPKHPSALVEALDPRVEHVILQCLQKDALLRPKSARAVAAGLPGRDPLAAALAAGETPSPEMVAAAGEHGVLRNWVAMIWVGMVGISLGLACWLAQSTYRVNQAGLTRHPQAMASDARRIIERLGYLEQPVDWEFGFADQGKDSLRFYYRQRPSPFLVFDFFTSSQMSYGHIEENIPRWGLPGELGLALDPKGKLLRFRAVPPLRPDSQPVSGQPDWSKWFPEEFTGFALDELQTVENKRLRPPDAYDFLRVWRGVWPHTTNEFFVEAAAYAGRPVYFEVFSPLQSGGPSSPAAQASARLLTWLYLSLNAGAGVLAWRNFRLRRSDRRGAFRVALYFFVVGLLISLLQAHHTTEAAEGGVFEMSLGQASVRAILFWLWYTALEPYVRRFWPQSLISWARLLDARWRDSLVGRDLLAGTVFGIAITLADQVKVLSDKWLGLAAHAFISSPAWTLAGPGGLLADYLFKQIDAAFKALFCLLFLLLLRFVFRKMWLASLVFIAVITTLFVLGGEAPAAADWVAWALKCGLLLGALIRFGLLAAVALIWTADLLTFPLTTDLSAWYASHGLAGVGMVAAIALFGAFTSKGAQPLFRDEPEAEVQGIK